MHNIHIKKCLVTQTTVKKFIFHKIIMTNNIQVSRASTRSSERGYGIEIYFRYCYSDFHV